MVGFATWIVLSIGLCLSASDADAARSLTADEFANLERNCAAYPAATELRERLIAAPDDRLLNASDEFLIDFVPNPRVKRTPFITITALAYGCPIHGGGRYVFRESANPFVPYKLTCSIGGETYPNEDFPESGTPESPWDEQGWLDTRETVDGKANPTCGLRYHWNAHYAFWGRWMKLGSLMQQLAESYVLAEKDDPRKARAGHNAAVLLIRLATVFPHMQVADYCPGDWVPDFPFRLRITDYIWEPKHTAHYATSYDYVREAILNDESLLVLDYDRDGIPWKEQPGHDYNNDGAVTTADLTVCIEQDLFREYARLYRAIPPSYGNATIFQMRAFAWLAIALDEPAFYEYARSTLLDYIATNWFVNDGAYYEGAIPVYGRLCIRSLRETFALLRRYDPALVSSRVVKGFQFMPSLVCIDRAMPNPDDAGGVSLNRLAGTVQFPTGEYRQAFLDYRDPAILRTLAVSGGVSGDPVFKTFGDLFAGTTHEERSVLENALDGYRLKRLPSLVTRSGSAVLRGGSDQTPFDLFISFDGFGGSHTHFDMFNGILCGFDYVLVPDLGYPDDLASPARHDWINHTLSHWTVTVDRKRMGNPFLFPRGDVELFVDKPGFKTFSGNAPRCYEGATSTYRRTFCMIDKPDGLPLVIDFFEVRGGGEHLYSFHAPAEDASRGVTVDGGAFGKLSPYETLQGHWHSTKIPYRKPPGEDPLGSGRCLAYVEAVRIVTPEPGTQALRFSFPRGDDEHTQLDLWMPVACAEEFVLGEGRSCPNAPQRNVQLPYLIARHGTMDASDTASLFCTVLEPHRGDRDVASVSFSPGDRVLHIRFEDGGKWRVCARKGQVEFSSFSADGHPRRETRFYQSERRRIGALDKEARRVTWQEESNRAAVKPREYLMVTNALGRNTFYRVEAADSEDGTVTIGDPWTDLRIARGFFTGESDGARLRYDQDYLIQWPIRDQCRGARIFNETGRECRVIRVTDDTIELDATAKACADFATDADGDGDCEFEIYDFGVGDQGWWIAASDTVSK